ncbi:hypothetical protein AB0395_26750 [Streptosporangium sp. NPDC051023]|uniref:hypothetical protein n=1 Tax=Streptosporangium sp. NPDC051023 TaxID=3155410 RepID=UPI00344D9C2E
MRHPSGSALSWLGHPVTVIAVFVLLVNDHVLKVLWPGPVTGKLSDVAGLLVAPPLLALVRVPPLAATIATGVGFTLVKSTEAGAALASQAWSLLAGPSRVLADPTDLVALPALGLAWLVWRRCRSDHAVRRARTLIIVPVALVAVTATSGLPSPSAVSVLADGETITVFADHPYQRIVSQDGGRTWSVQRTSPSAPTPTPPPGVTRACLPDSPRHCYRVVPPRLAVDESLDGGTSWNTVWEVSPGREGALRRRVTDYDTWPWRGSTAIAAQSRPDGHVVVAADGNDGVAVRDARGTWRRLGFSDKGLSEDAAPPLHSLDLDLTPEYLAGFFTGLFGFMLCLALARRRRPRGRVLSPTAYTLVSIGFAVSMFFRSGLLAPLILLAALACALIAAGLTVASGVMARVPVPAWLTAAVTAPCTAATICVIFSGWASGTPDDYSTAVLLACVAGGVGVAASAVVGWMSAENPAGDPTAEADPAM